MSATPSNFHFLKAMRVEWDAQIEEQKALVQTQAARSEALFQSLLQEALG